MNTSDVRGRAFRTCVMLACAVLLAAPAAAMERLEPGAPGAGVLDTPAIAVASPAHVILDAAAMAGKRVVAGGEHGVIALSDDDGATWSQAEVPVSATITAIAFADARVGYATGHFGTVLRTDDAGAHWRLVLDGRAIPGLMQAAAGDDAKALHVARLMAGDGPDKPFLAIQIVSPEQVRVYGASGIAVATDDGGASWKDISRSIENPAGLNLYGVVARPDGAIFIAGEQGLLLAGDAASGLHKLTSPYNGSFFGAVAPNDHTLLAYGLIGHAFVSPDQGAHWTPVRTEHPITLDSALRRSDGTVLLGDSQGQIWRLSGTGDGAALVPSGVHAPWPVIALCETPTHAVLAFGLGGALRLPEAVQAQR